MQKKILLSIAFITLLFSCNQSDSENFKLNLEESNPLELRIDNFYWQIDNDRVTGDFKALDNAMSKKLRGQEGICEIYLGIASNGANDKRYLYLGWVNLSSTQDWSNYINEGGLKTMLEKNLQSMAAEYNQRMSDTTEVTQEP